MFVEPVYDFNRSRGAAGILMFVAVLAVACTHVTAPASPFTTVQLLIGLSDMPKGWTISDGPEKATEEPSSVDSAAIVFIADGDAARRVARHSVYRFNSATQARWRYRRSFVLEHFGAAPSAWSYASSAADESDFSCYDYGGQTPPVCLWSARYGEYVVTFSTWLVPGRMSIETIEPILRAIDELMAFHQKKDYQ
jgi:hypothetical protein